MFTTKRNYVNRILAVVMALLVSVTLLPQMALTTRAENQTYSGPVMKEDGQVTFYYQGNGTETDVRVKGSWNWELPTEEMFVMTKDENNLFSVTTTGLSQETAYQYGILVDGNWVGDSANQCTAGNSQILRNPVMTEDGSAMIYYYPSHGTVPSVEVQYQKEGESDWKSVTMEMDSVNTSILSAKIFADAGNYSYKLLVDGVEKKDLSAANGQKFTIKEMPKADPSVDSPVITEDGVVFSYFAPTAKNVYLAGSMNGWSDSADAMTYNAETGYFTITKKLAAGPCEYKFVVDGNWVTDPLNEEQQNGNSLVTVPVPDGVKSPVINNSGVTLVYDAKDADKVQLMGTATTWDPASAPEMVKDEETGKWYITLALEAGDYQYKFLVNGSDWVTDPNNADQADGNSAFTVKGDEKYKSPVVGKDEVTFFYAPGEGEEIKKLRLAGSMTDWQNAAEEFTKNEDGTYSLTKKLSAGSYEYKFIANEDGWMTDPSNPDVNNGGNSLLLVPGLKAIKDSVVIGKAKELPAEGEYFAGDDNKAHKVKVSYELADAAEGLTLEDGVLTVSDTYTEKTVTLKMIAGNETADVVLDVVAAQYTYNIYYYDAAHNTVDAADLWIWENNGAGATDGRAFTEAVTMEDGKTWLKASVTVPYTEVCIIPRSKGAWDWQSATVTYKNTDKKESQDIYILADDNTAYTELPEIVEEKDRHVILEYQRANGDYDNWNIYTWNSGFGSEVSVDATMQGDKVVYDIPIKKTTGNLSFVMRRSTEDNVWEEKDGGDNNIITPLDQTVIRAVFVEGKGVTYVYPYNTGHELDGENDQIHFYYRDEDAFLADTGKDLEGKVQVEINGTAYDMTYDEETGRLVYDLTGLEEGEYLYRYIVDGESVVDAYNKETKEVDGITYSVCRYQKFDAETSAKITPATITPVENAVLKVNVPKAEGLKVASITADASSIGGKKALEISPELNAVTISVADTLAAGTYEIPVCVEDQYGNTYRTLASVTVEAGSSDWDESIIYFMVTDRFFDGNASNNGENYDPEDPGMYHGGDFAGVTQKLDYLKDLGVNTIWITPIVENISEQMKNDNADVPATVGYAGYWADDFTKLDSHLGTEEEFQTMIDAAHEKGIKIMVDVVLNHAGYNTKDIFGDMLRDDSNTIPGDEVKDGLSGLPDFVTENAEVRDQLVKWQTAWVENFGIDYFRVDTVKHVENTTWQALKNSLTEVNPEFKMIGEYSGAGYSYDGGQLKSGQMDSLLDFDFNNQGLELASGNLTNVENFLEKRNAVLTSDATLGSFLSSHDEDGLLYDIINDLGIDETKARGLMKVAASMQMTAKGQPVIYYGEELGQTGANNYPYNTNRYDFDWANANDSNDMYNHYKKIIALRNEYSDVFSKGTRQSLYVDDEQGVMVFDRVLDGKHVVTALNISDEAKTVSFDIPEGLESLKGNLYAAENADCEAVDDKVTITVPAAGDGGTYVLTGSTKAEPETPEETTPEETTPEETTPEETTTVTTEETTTVKDQTEETDESHSGQIDTERETTASVETTTAVANNDQESTTPQTGDNSQAGILLAILLLAGGAAAVAIVGRRKKKVQ